MSEEEIALTKKDQFALEVAQAKSVVGWARKNEVPTSTAYRWANDRDVRRNVEDWRRRSLDRALGQMARCSIRAVNTISRLGEAAESESVQGVAGRFVRHDRRRQEKMRHALTPWRTKSSVVRPKNRRKDATRRKSNATKPVSHVACRTSSACVRSSSWFRFTPSQVRRISTARYSEPDPVYLRAAAGTSTVVACPPAATPRGHVHQWINAVQPNNSPTFSKLFQRPTPSQAGQARSASRSAVPKSDLDPASDPGRRALLHGCPGKRRAISVGVHYSSRAPRPTKRGGTETCFAGESDAAGMAPQAPSAAPSGRHNSNP